MCRSCTFALSTAASAAASRSACFWLSPSMQTRSPGRSTASSSAVASRAATRLRRASGAAAARRAARAVFDSNPKVSFLAHAAKLQAAAADGKVLAPAKSIAQMQRIIFNDYVDAALSALFILVVVSIAVYGVIAVARARRAAQPTSRETPYEQMPAAQALGSGR